MSDLKNKNIIVTGASGGIGNAIIKKLSEAGANILASGTRVEKLEELTSELGGLDLLILSSGTGDLNETLDFEIRSSNSLSNFPRLKLSMIVI